MSKKTDSRQPTDTRRALRPLTPRDLQQVTGGYGVPGQYKSSTGGGGTTA